MPGPLESQRQRLTPADQNLLFQSAQDTMTITIIHQNFQPG